jgi:SAM-dependent methyltransferase
VQQTNCQACGRACDGTEFVFTFKSGRGVRQWKRCPGCKAYFLEEVYDARQELTHAEGTGFGSERIGRDLNSFKRRMFVSVLDLLKKNCPPPGSLLDVGCSYGGFLMHARDAGYAVSGFDIIPKAVDYVRSQEIPAEVAFSIGDLTALTDGTLDVITCLDCHYYWPNQPAELAHAYRKLKPGGFLAMRVADKSWMFSTGLWLRNVSDGLGEKALRASVNDHRFSMPIRSLLKLIRRTGFDVRYASPRGAIYSDRTKLPVKISFAIGTILWQTSGIFVAPGALVLARKPR